MLRSTIRKGRLRTACALAATFTVFAGGSVATATGYPPTDPRIDIEKLTNGNYADGSHDPDVPRIAPGDPVTWTYVVTNTGGVPFAEADVTVNDNVVGAITQIVDQGDGDGVLSPGEVWVYEATGVAEDLASSAHETYVVDGCHPDGSPERPTYENYGKVVVPGAWDKDYSHYCNPSDPGIDIEKLTNGNQADGANDADVPEIAPGDPVTWTYIVTNTGAVPFAEAEVTVVDSIAGVTPVLDPTSDVGGDGVLSPGEVWVYEATGVAEDLANPSAGTVVVDGCNPDGTQVPGDRATYENIGTVTVPGDGDSDPSHYCNPPERGIDIEKLTNGNQADGANDADVPEIAPGDPVTWTYIVTNTGDVAIAAADVAVTDDIVGAITNIVDQGDGDGVLSPGEVWTYEASAAAGAEDLENPSAGTVVVSGCNPDGTNVPGDRATYENIGTVTIPGDTDADPSHYCNPPERGIDIEKLTNGNQADGANDADVPEIAPGDPVTWTYIVTNTGDVAFAQAEVVVDDDIIGAITNIVDQGDGDGVLSPGEVWTYEASAAAGAEDLANPSAGTVVVDGCNPDGTQVPGDRATYENIGTVTVPGDGDSDPSHYCNPLTAALGDFVWLDQNRNGIQDPTEPGVEDVAVELQDCSGGFVASATTGPDGEYLFDGLEPGGYVVVFTSPDGLVFTVQNAGDDDTVDSDVDASGTTGCVDLAPGETNLTVDAGLIVPTAALGDFVWLDQNRNGIQDPTEPGVEDVAVELQDCSGGFVASATTGPDGEYLFDGLEPGGYVVVFTSPDGLVFTVQNAGDDDTVDSDVDASGTTGCVDLAPGETNLTVDAGLIVPTAALGDFVWLDQNRNGIQDPTEPGVEDVAVELQDCSGGFVASATTGPDGEYLFDGLEPGGYVVVFTSPDGLVFTVQNAGDDDTVDSDVDASGTTGCVDLAPGETNLTVDAGLIVPTAALGDFVWLDQNRNGIQDPTEPGVEDVAVELQDCSGGFVASATTGPDGEYLFDGLEPGGYVVVFTSPDGLVFTVQNAGDDDTVDSDVDASGTTGCVDLAPGETNLTVDAGLIVPTAALGDFVWLDQNRNGIQDPTEPGVEDVAVELQDCSGGFVASATTGPDGEYLFDGLEPGGYVVVFTSPDGLVFTVQNAGDDDTVDSDVDASGTTGCVDLAPGETNLTVDAGLIVPLVPDVDIEKYTKVQPTGGADGDLCDVYDKPEMLTLRYVGGSALTQDQGGKATVSGDPGTTSPVRIVVSDGGSKVFFDGLVDLGDDFVADASFDKFGSNSVVTVSNTAGTVLQVVELHTSCSQPLNLGDVFGSVQLVGFTDVNGDGATLPDPDPSDIGEDADVPTGPEANTGDTIVWTYIVTNPGDVPLADVTVVDDAGTPGDTSDDFSPAPVLDGGVNIGDDDGDGLLDPGEEWRYTASGTAQLGQYGNLSDVVGLPVDDDGVPTGDDEVTDEDPSHYIGVFGGDLCEFFGKPSVLTMVYTGDGPDGSSNSQDPGKVIVTGDPNDASPVRIVASENEDGGGKIYFDGIVELGEEFVVDSTNAGDDSLKSSTHITVYAVNGNVLQRIEFHTSCSQPLFLGDQFGSARLVDFVDENGSGPADIGAPAGDTVDVVKLELKDKKVKFTLKNNGVEDATIVQLDLVWPEAVNGGLKKIKDQFDYKPPAGSPLTITEWKDVSRLVIEAGKDRDYELEFERNVDTNQANYSIVVTFSDGSSLTVAP